jgi:ribonuclease D
MAQTPADPEQAWKRINGNGRLDETSLAILKSLATWRDLEAEKRNLARGFFIKDAALLEMAKHKPGNQAALASLGILHPKVLERQGPTISRIVAKVLQEDQRVSPQKMLTPSQRKLLAGMKALVQKKSAELSIEPALLASKRHLEGLILSPRGGPLPERFAGWRKEIITDALVTLMEQH